MGIRIIRRGSDYSAVITPPHGHRASITLGPLPQNELISQLQSLGCHQTDIGDAFYEADPEWLDRTNQDSS
jgi:hypothetical protein